MGQKKISKIDQIYLKKIRENVDFFLEKQAKIYDIQHYLILDIAPQEHKGAKAFFKKSTIQTLDINPKSKTTYIADICKTNHTIISSQKFDVIVCTEVLEHTLNPFKAVTEIHRILKKEGIILISVPFNFRIHGPLPDCWRISEHGLKALFNKESGFEILELNILETENRFLMPIHYTLVAKKLNN